MKIFNETKLTVVAKATSMSQDGKTTYYRLACLQNGQATNISVTEELYNTIPSGFTDAVFITSYDDKYQSFKIDRIAEIVSVNGEKPGIKPDAKPSGTPAAK